MIWWMRLYQLSEISDFLVIDRSPRRLFRPGCPIAAPCLLKRCPGDRILPSRPFRLSTVLQVVQPVLRTLRHHPQINLGWPLVRKGSHFFGEKANFRYGELILKTRTNWWQTPGEEGKNMDGPRHPYVGTGGDDPRF